MEPQKLINAFLTVVKEQDFVFDDKAITDIPTLQQALEKFQKLENPTIASLADTIRLWYINHESVRDEVLIAEKEIQEVKDPNPNSQENTVTNQAIVVQDELEKLKSKHQEQQDKQSE